jgi:hypothetical protein
MTSCNVQKNSYRCPYSFRKHFVHLLVWGPDKRDAEHIDPIATLAEPLDPPDMLSRRDGFPVEVDIDEPYLLSGDSAL